MTMVRIVVAAAVVHVSVAMLPLVVSKLRFYYAADLLVRSINEGKNVML